MVFEKDDDEGLPELPALKTRSGLGLPPIGEEAHRLPSFPDSPSHNRFSQAAIKGAVDSDEDDDFLPEVEEDGKKMNVVEMEEWNPEHAKMAEAREPETLPGFQEPKLYHSPQASLRPMADRKADVYVKLDKFYSARKDLGEIKEKLEEIDEVIKKIRETKLREEQELSGWEREIMNVKARMKEVGENIFEKVE